MASSSTAGESPVSLMMAMDGIHLGWSDFRSRVLSSFRIVFTEGLQVTDIPEPFPDELHSLLRNLSRFSAQERDWRSQVPVGQGFGSTLIFPPNVLPFVHDSRLMDRCLAPKLNREALPPRAVRAQESLFELPAPRPALISGFKTSAFNETELTMLPNCTSALGTIVDFASGTVSAGINIYGPFLVFERMLATSDDEIQSAKNRCAVAGAHCIRAMQLLFGRGGKTGPVLETPVSFSCAINNSMAVMNYHYVDETGCYCMCEIATFNLDNTDTFKEFQGWIEAIERWGCVYLLPVIKVRLRQMLRSNETPPISPMPSLTLSIDTAAGNEDVLMKILRATFGSIKWKCDGDCETPLNSSIAHCGTPVGVRKIRTMALSPISPTHKGSGDSVAGLHTPFRTWRMRPDWGVRSPTGRKHSVSPLRLKSNIPESPCRPATLSPCTPPPDAPVSARSPMLVLQKRVDLAMDEIQELRALVQTLQTDLLPRKLPSELNNESQASPKQVGGASGFWIASQDTGVLPSKMVAVAVTTLFFCSRWSSSALPMGSLLCLLIVLGLGCNSTGSTACIDAMLSFALNGMHGWAVRQSKAVAT
ncbi:hypothetical protein A1O1_07295 [Capronia coronata CBS 617.96]|uniref:DUF7924 domain-containing protein n=1 Tax=Capronia coronata CBS 617.96 TaxID=1182541 RepID=W9Y348_9EURO|nr:uncharacterized protein A1O1_07295 [Capronia coronata CBS 617.96]EXJ83671.1 hypothetical protein A1O1_07295 [Capronia coronata CBS 617.96]